MKNPKRNFFFIEKGVLSIRNYAGNPKKMVPMLYKYYFLRKLGFFQEFITEFFSLIARGKESNPIGKKVGAFPPCHFF